MLRNCCSRLFKRFSATTVMKNVAVQTLCPEEVLAQSINEYLAANFVRSIEYGEEAKLRGYNRLRRVEFIKKDKSWEMTAISALESKESGDATVCTWTELPITQDNINKLALLATNSLKPKMM